MESELFVQAYPEDLSDRQIHAGGHSKIITEAQDRSYQFGQLLHIRGIAREALGENDRPMHKEAARRISLEYSISCRNCESIDAVSKHGFII